MRKIHHEEDRHYENNGMDRGYVVGHFFFIWNAGINVGAGVIFVINNFSSENAFYLVTDDTNYPSGPWPFRECLCHSKKSHYFVVPNANDVSIDGFVF